MNKTTVTVTLGNGLQIETDPKCAAQGYCPPTGCGCTDRPQAEAEYHTALDAYNLADKNLQDARLAVRQAEQEMHEANENLARHEARPGIPAYTQQPA